MELVFGKLIDLLGEKAITSNLLYADSHGDSLETGKYLTRKVVFVHKKSEVKKNGLNLNS